MFVGPTKRLGYYLLQDERLIFIRFLCDDIKKSLLPTYYEDPFQYKVVSPSAYLQLNQRYSGCALTFDKDKIAAMTGMISSIRERHGMHFNAGIWLNFPHHSLLWFRKRTGPMRRLDGFDFPSWTWAAYDGEVEFVSGQDGFEPRRDLQMSIMRNDGKSAPFRLPMKLTGPVVQLKPDVRIEVRKELCSGMFADQWAIKSSMGEAIGCVTFDNPDDDGEGVECLIVEEMGEDHRKRNLPTKKVLGQEGSFAFKVQRRYATQYIRNSGNNHVRSSSQIVIAESGALLPRFDDRDYTWPESINEKDTGQEQRRCEEYPIAQDEGADITAVSPLVKTVDLQQPGFGEVADEPPRHLEMGGFSTGNTVGLGVIAFSLCEQQIPQRQSTREWAWDVWIMDGW
jgi:hypothetical protein